MKRKFLSIYFPYADSDGAKQNKNLCIAFSEKEFPLFEKMKAVTSGTIKKKIRIHSYDHLTKVAKAENRKAGDVIKQRFIEKASNRRREKVRTVKIDSKKVRLWLRALKKTGDIELIEFLKSLL